MHSHKEFVLSDYETSNTALYPVLIQHDVYTSSNLSHTMPCEQGGMPMLDIAKAMKSDAELQIEMLGLLTDRLDWLVQTNDQRRKESLPVFEGTQSPITASQYVQRIRKYGSVSECCFLVAIIYIERLKLAGHVVRLSSTSLQRLLAVAVMVAAKFLDEPFYSNKWWAQIAGLELSEINALEREFLFLLGFRLAVRRDEYDACAAALAAPPIKISSSPTGSVPQCQPARPDKHDPVVFAAADVGASHSCYQQAQPRPAETRMDLLMPSADRVCISGGESGGECGIRVGCSELCGGVSRMLREDPGPIAPSGPVLMN